MTSDIDDRIRNLESDLDKLAKQKCDTETMEEKQVKVWMDILTQWISIKLIRYSIQPNEEKVERCRQIVEEMLGMASGDASEKAMMTKLQLVEDHLQSAKDKLGIVFNLSQEAHM